jgi:hypothetical protein
MVENSKHKRKTEADFEVISIRILGIALLLWALIRVSFLISGL